ncbi:uncharacterized protein LOC119342849 [Triticum dicoccoides]|uniref:uncharacterized protein LOC119342849 n=1 Tax=Triticum dicoccoides TaxID=85692 RepID=UPI00188F9058|nr:uncharacterized protein LOC119342849 [Triticum dicoccoides]
MFASICRRRPLRIHQTAGGGGRTNPLEFIPGTIPLAHCHTSPAVAEAPSPEPCPDSVSYLISRGLSPTAAGAATTSQHLRIRSTDKADAVRALLKLYGFTDADIVRALRSAPVLLVFDPERILRPKLDLFASLGFEPRKLASEPFLLGRSLDKHLVPAIQFLRGIIGSDDNLRLAFHRAPRALSVDLNNNMRPAVEALRRGGLGEADISKLLVIHLGVLMSSPYRIGEIFEELKAMGMSILDPRFLYCFRAMSSLKRESWLRKLAFYQSFGLSEGEVLEAFKKQPTIFLFTDESINKKVRFLLDELKLGIRDVIARPVVLAYSLEKCILPRCAVLSVLMREGRIQRYSIKLLQALLGSSGNFSTRFVLRHADDVPDVVKAYEGKIRFEGFK